ncbi:MAG: flippase-like domain-containing protein [Deltaproteobacteria bacterium]|nr:flippase-like domain-containing protein [Deltaproteobacteria bacterium]
MDRTIQILAIVNLIFLGNLAVLFKIKLPFYAWSILLATAILLVVFVIFFIFHQSRGLFQTLGRFLNKLPFRKFSEATLAKIEQTDEQLHTFYKQDKRLFFYSFFLQMAAKLIGVIEIMIVARFLGVAMGPWEALLFTAVIPIVHLVGWFIPGAVGILEVVTSSLFGALHWNPADGLVLQMILRLRVILWMSLGWVFLFIDSRISVLEILGIKERSPRGKTTSEETSL